MGLADGKGDSSAAGVGDHAGVGTKAATRAAKCFAAGSLRASGPFWAPAALAWARTVVPAALMRWRRKCAANQPRHAGRNARRERCRWCPRRGVSRRPGWQRCRASWLWPRPSAMPAALGWAWVPPGQAAICRNAQSSLQRPSALAASERDSLSQCTQQNRIGRPWRFRRLPVRASRSRKLPACTISMAVRAILPDRRAGRTASGRPARAAHPEGGQPR